MLISKCLPKDRRSFNWLSLSCVAMLAAAGCSTRATSNPSPSLTPAAATAVEEGVRGLMRTVATDVSQHGPLAWRNYFDPGPSFFMAVNGRMAFPTGAAASEGTEAFAKTIQHIELAWGDVRVDPLTPEFAMVAAPWREVQVDTAGHRVDESGFFSAITEYRGGRWQFRDAHWSSALTGIRGF